MRSIGTSKGVWLLALAAASALGCATGGSVDGSAAGAGGAGPAGTGAADTSASSGPLAGTGGTPELGAGGANGGQTTASGEGGACASVSVEAHAELAPADIVIAVDTSGSMFEEEAEVQANLNTFASFLAASGVDAHVVLIADETVCIPPPLGSGQCNGQDQALPGYTHVLQSVGSHDALGKIIGTYPKWKGALRPGATKTFAVVSDDDSSLSAAAFTTALLDLDPSFAGFKFDAIVASESPAVCDECFFECGTCVHACCDKAFFCMEIPAAEGKVYAELVAQTGGVMGDLCVQDFDPVFEDMADAVVTGSTLTCAFAIPAPPDGEQLDPAKVNFAYTKGGGGEAEVLPQVPGGAAGCGQADGWYYDDPASPTQILVCPATCATLSADATGKVDVLFGCTTEVLPPE
jgi:hypothetical protein